MFENIYTQITMGTVSTASWSNVDGGKDVRRACCLRLAKPITDGVAVVAGTQDFLRRPPG